MKDILPKEMAIRNYVMNMIRETYGTFGFSAIETPCVEHIENLCSKQGGENEKLIFKIMKRGEKLKLDTAKTENDLIFIEKDTPLKKEEIDEKLEVLRNAIESEDDNDAREALRSVVPTFRRPEEINQGVK